MLIRKIKLIKIEKKRKKNSNGFALHLFYGGRNPLSRFWKAATYIPKAKVFFRPLYYEYSGNFKVSHDRKKWANRKFDVFSKVVQQVMLIRGLLCTS